MQSISIGIVILGVIACSSGSRLGQYVVPNSVKCDSNGIAFTLTTDNSTSKLYLDTGLDVTLSTGPYDYNCSIDDEFFNRTSGQVFLNYTQCPLKGIAVATGIDKRPLHYLIEQPFRANYSNTTNYYFKIFCWIPASYHTRDVIIDTEDEDNTGDDTGDRIRPGNHVNFKVPGAKPGEQIALGKTLHYEVTLNDEVYDAVLPVDCKFYDVKNPWQSIPFVQNGCPVQFPDDDIDEYFHTMVKRNQKSYDIQFKAFAFGGQEVNSQLGIDCDILLCIRYDIRDCTKECWGTSEAANATTKAAESSTAATTEAVLTTTAREEKRRKRGAGNLRGADDVRSTMYHDQKILNIASSAAGGDNNPKGQPVDSNVLTTGLYAVMGALALVALALAAVVAIFLYRSRGAKAAGNDREMIFAHRQASVYDTRGQPLVRGA